MGRILILLVLATLACRLMTGRWPWTLLGWEPVRTSARFRAEAQARALLGVGKDAGRNDIIDAHKRLIMQVHPDRGGTSEQVHEANAARDLLLARLLDHTA